METSDICRVCMEDDGENFMSLFNLPEGCKTIPSVMIVDCAGVEIDKDDGLPGMICSECLCAIKEAYKIRSKCRNTDRKLRKILNLNKKLDVKQSLEDSLEKTLETRTQGETVLNDAGRNNPPSSSAEQTIVDEKPSVRVLVDQPTPLENANEQARHNHSLSSTILECPSWEDINQFKLKQESNDIKNKQEDVCLELVLPSLVLVKQEGKQPVNTVYEAEYLVEELKECLSNDISNRCDPDDIEEKKDDGEHSSVAEAILPHDNEGDSTDGEESMKMEVEALEDDECEDDECENDEYEDYEAIEEDLENGEQEDVTQSNDNGNCCGCPMEFATRLELDDHSKTIHLPEKDKNTALQDWYMCDICYRKHSSLKALKFHKTNRYNKKMRTCNSCQLVLHSVRKRRHHEMLHKTIPDDYEINCCGCNQVIPFKKLGSHSEQVHRNNDQVLRSKFVCEVCFLDCGFKQRLENHQSKQELPTLERRQPTQQQPDRKFNAPTADIDGKQRFICDICGNNFSTKGNLKSHRSLHDSHKPFKCTICDKSFSKKSNYNVHMLRAHSTESSFFCSVCSKSFRCSTNLKTHMRVHTKERPYVCTFCPKNFGHLSDKRRHEITHSGNYPFKCDRCSKPFTRRTLLEKHAENCGRRLNKNVFEPVSNGSRGPTSEPVPAPNGNSNLMACDLCESGFASVEELAEHHAEMHIQTLDEGTYDAEIEIE